MALAISLKTNEDKKNPSSNWLILKVQKTRTLDGILTWTPILERASSWAKNVTKGLAVSWKLQQTTIHKNSQPDTTLIQKLKKASALERFSFLIGNKSTT